MDCPDDRRFSLATTVTFDESKGPLNIRQCTDGSDTKGCAFFTNETGWFRCQTDCTEYFVERAFGNGVKKNECVP